MGKFISFFSEISYESKHLNLWLVELKNFPHTNLGIWNKYHFSKPLDPDNFSNSIGGQYHLIRMEKEKFYAVGFVKNQMIYFTSKNRRSIKSKNIKLIRKIHIKELTKFDKLVEQYKLYKPNYSDMQIHMDIDDEIEKFVRKNI